ncbi:hypothetical protein EYF80_007898 [Liparis tanakae]|uniref:Uncharacterized protein n=1 Tax=Liparis tanakae TaxID=230148 RepID=A0A4Z2IUT5_9TELE|nr:hypothetical protein EYF80_007898 [Liparis tanakae]
MEGMSGQRRLTVTGPEPELIAVRHPDLHRPSTGTSITRQWGAFLDQTTMKVFLQNISCPSAERVSASPERYSTPVTLCSCAGSLLTRASGSPLR